MSVSIPTHEKEQVILLDPSGFGSESVALDYTQISPNSYHWPPKDLGQSRFFGGHGFIGIFKDFSENQTLDFQSKVGPGRGLLDD